MVVLAVIIVGIIAGVILLRQSTGRPRAGDHWHALYQVVVCGETLPPFAGPLAGGESDPRLGIHSHGDARIHNHPGSASNPADAEGKRANLVRFFTGFDVVFNKDVLTLPDGRRLSNGDSCPETSPLAGQKGTFRFFVGRTENPLAPAAACSDFKENGKFERYVPQDGACIRIAFGPASALAEAASPSTPAPASPSTPTATARPSSPAPTATP